MNKIDSLLTLIAKQHLGIETLETRNSDSLDFHDVGVVSLKEALYAAFVILFRRKTSSLRSRI